ncbi:MAG: hypothetical protein NT013_30715, partial [Planctomycetia bacterium]|nr:hypothetical protein [Planctomycetia bacterium]
AITPTQQFSANCQRIVEIGFRGQCDYFVWKNHDPFESACADLLRDLQAQKYIERAGGKSSCTIPAMHSSWPICEFGWHVLIIGMGVEIAITFELHALSDGQGRATHAYKFNSNRTSSQP